MIPLALKEAWFWLALLGLLQIWALFVVFPGRRYGGLWGRIYYCCFVTLLEGMFCLGMIWHMNPQRMPHAFCLVQVVSFSLASFGLTGLCSSFTVANALAVCRPHDFDNGKAVLAWHPRYIPLLIIFPVVASAIHTALLITTDAVQPSLSDDLHCDATHPLWMRLVGYAGVPLVVSLPFLAISFHTAYRLVKISRNPTTEVDSTDMDGPVPVATLTQSYEMNESKRRNRAFRLTAFLPYPTLFSRSSPALAGSSEESSTPHDRGSDQHEYPLHKHPFPAIDPLTGKAYSPSLEEPCTTPFASLHYVNATAQQQGSPHSYDDSQVADRVLSLTPPDLDAVRAKSSTPDSAYSSSMPVFAPNLTLGAKSPPSINASGTHLHLQTVDEASDVQVGLAITTDDSPAASKLEMHQEELDGGEAMGLAVTTDEPDARAVTPVSTLGAPSSRPNGSPTPSDAHTLHDAPRDPARPPESRTRTLSSSMHPIRPSPDITPYLLSSPGSAAFPPLHHRHHPSLISSATIYSGAYPTSDREDRELLPFTPGSVSSFQSQITPKDTGIELVLDLDMRKQTVGGGSTHEGDPKGDAHVDADWDYEEYDGEGVPVRTIKPRDPRERLGVYNPTPPTPTAAMLERRRRKLRRREHEERGSTRRLVGAIWRMVLFQIAFFTIQLLASLSSILDVAHNRITPFGTQHVALLLAAWGPLFIFGRVPSTFRFWKKW